jgi:hypothetical protein
VLVGYAFGECPAEIAVGVCTLNDIERAMDDGWQADPRYCRPQAAPAA